MILITFKSLKKNIGMDFHYQKVLIFLISLKNSLLNAVDEISASYLKILFNLKFFFFKKSLKINF
jgi:hypothetical protein